MLDTLSAQNRFALAFRIHNMKTEAGRKRKIETFVEMLKRGETIYPKGPSKRPRDPHVGAPATTERHGGHDGRLWLRRAWLPREHGRVDEHRNGDAAEGAQEGTAGVVVRVGGAADEDAGDGRGDPQAEARPRHGPSFVQGVYGGRGHEVERDPDEDWAQATEAASTMSVCQPYHSRSAASGRST